MNEPKRPIGELIDRWVAAVRREQDAEKKARAAEKERCVAFEGVHKALPKKNAVFHRGAAYWRIDEITFERRDCDQLDAATPEVPTLAEARAEGEPDAE